MSDKDFKRWVIQLLSYIAAIITLNMLFGAKVSATELPMKIDTICDTTGVDIIKKPFEECRSFYPWQNYKVLGDTVFYMVPHVDTTTDTTYRLSEEQVDMLWPTEDSLVMSGSARFIDSAKFREMTEAPDIISIVVDTLYGTLTTYPLTDPDSLLNARIDSLIKVIEGLHPKRQPEDSILLYIKPFPIQKSSRP